MDAPIDVRDCCDCQGCSLFAKWFDIQRSVASKVVSAMHWVTSGDLANVRRFKVGVFEHRIIRGRGMHLF